MICCVNTNLLFFLPSSRCVLAALPALLLQPPQDTCCFGSKSYRSVLITGMLLCALDMWTKFDFCLLYFSLLHFPLLQDSISPLLQDSFFTIYTTKCCVPISINLSIIFYAESDEHRAILNTQASMMLMVQENLFRLSGIYYY
jgi:hypothetical protein